jgi:hypothetical protein
MYALISFPFYVLPYFSLMMGSQLTGGQKKRRSSRTKQETKTPSKLPGSVSQEPLAFLPNVSKVPLLSEGFFWRKDSLKRLNSPQDPRQSLRGKRIK